MKKIFLAFSVMLLSILYSHAQMNKIDEIFDKYQDTEGLTSVKIGKPMFRMLNNLNIQDEDLAKIKPLLKDINSIQILIFEKDSIDNPNRSSGQQNNLSNEIFSAVKNLHFQELMSVNSKGQKIRFLTEDASSNIINKLVLSITGNSQNILMLLDGKVNMDDISKLADDK
ncbi:MULTISPECIES: DUF4252 domain-containing protein [Chitinophagaceae]